MNPENDGLKRFDPPPSPSPPHPHRWIPICVPLAALVRLLGAHSYRAYEGTPRRRLAPRGVTRGRFLFLTVDTMREKMNPAPYTKLWFQMSTCATSAPCYTLALVEENDKRTADETAYIAFNLNLTFELAPLHLSNAFFSNVNLDLHPYSMAPDLYDDLSDCWPDGLSSRRAGGGLDGGAAGGCAGAHAVRRCRLTSCGPCVESAWFQMSTCCTSRSRMSTCTPTTRRCRRTPRRWACSSPRASVGDGAAARGGRRGN